MPAVPAPPSPPAPMVHVVPSPSGVPGTHRWLAEHVALPLHGSPVLHFASPFAVPWMQTQVQSRLQGSPGAPFLALSSQSSPVSTTPLPHTFPVASPVVESSPPAASSPLTGVPPLPLPPPHPANGTRATPPAANRTTPSQRTIPLITLTSPGRLPTPARVAGDSR